MFLRTIENGASFGIVISSGIGPPFGCVSEYSFQPGSIVAFSVTRATPPAGDAVAGASADHFTMSVGRWTGATSNRAAARRTFMTPSYRNARSVVCYHQLTRNGHLHSKRHHGSRRT